MSQQKHDSLMPMEELDALGTLISQQPDQLRKLLDAFHDPLFIVNTKKKIIYFNKSAEQVTGYSADDIHGEECIVGIRCENCLYECALFEQKTVKNRKLRIHTKDGRELEILKNAQVFTNKEGNIIGGIETFRDITRSNRKRRQVQSEMVSLKSVLNHMDQGVVVIKKDGLVLMANNYLDEEFGQPTSQMKEKSLFKYFPDLTKSDIKADGSLLEKTTRFLTNDGSSNLVHIKPLKIETGSSSNAHLMFLVRKVRHHNTLKGKKKEEYSYRGLISKTPSMLEIFNLSETIADSDVSVLIQGESGTGKEVLARAIHDASTRKKMPFHVVNCAVFNENLLESELFGHCRGAFTGAVSDKIGRFELADKGTLFLDEIGEMPPNLQVKLLRFLQDQQFERVGEWKTRQVDVRIIAATNRNITEQIKVGEFRDDLYYRINVIPVFLPPLRDREIDIPLLLEYFIAKTCEERNLEGKVISAEALEILTAHTWPGNIRELQNIVLHALTCCKNSIILPRHLPRIMMETGDAPAIQPASSKDITSGPETTSDLETLEKEQIIAALQQNKFNRSKTADSLNTTRTTLWRKMKRYNLI